MNLIRCSCGFIGESKCTLCAIEPHKYCNTCQRFRPLRLFNKKLHGRQCCCRDCDANQSRNYRKKIALKRMMHDKRELPEHLRERYNTWLNEIMKSKMRDTEVNQ